MRLDALTFLPTNPSNPGAPDFPVLCDDDSSEWICFRELRGQISALSSIFSSSERGLIFCCVPRSIEGVIAYLSAVDSGHAVAVIDPALPSLQKFVDLYNPEWIWTSSIEAFSGYQNLSGSLQSIHLWRRQKFDESKVHPDLFLLFLTSGSTGSPKSVRLSYENIQQNVKAIVASLSITPKTRALGHLPLFYSYGLSVLHAQLYVGGSLLLSERGMMNKDLWQKIRDEKVTLFPGVPYHYEILQRLGLERLNVPSLDSFIQAGGKMPDHLLQDLLKEVQKRTGNLFVMYGQTEASPRMSCLPLHAKPEKAGSVGQALEGCSFEVENDEIIFNGPNVMLGYAEDRRDLILGDISHARLNTGDLGNLDADGYLTILGRKQRFAKIFGHRVSLDDLEDASRGVAQTVVIESGDKLAVLTTEVKEDIHGRLKGLIVDRTNIPTAWIEIKNVAYFPICSNGKIDYAKLRSMI